MDKYNLELMNSKQLSNFKLEVEEDYFVCISGLREVLKYKNNAILSLKSENPCDQNTLKEYDVLLDKFTDTVSNLSSLIDNIKEIQKIKFSKIEWIQSGF